jgi:hypothetical protein
MTVDYVAVWTRPGTGKKVPAAPEMTAGSAGAAPGIATRATAPR